MPSTIISGRGKLRDSLLRNLLTSKNISTMQKKATTRAISKTVEPARAVAQAHYGNMLEESVAFINNSSIDNGASGNVSYDVLTPKGGVVTAQSLVPWAPLSRKYAKRKANSKIWRETGSLAEKVSPLTKFSGVTVSNMRVRLAGATIKKLGTFTFSLKFTGLPRVFDRMLRDSFVSGAPVSFSSLPTVPVGNRDNINRINFLEKYRPGNLGKKGGPGRPMLTSIASTLGKVMRKDLFALRPRRS